MNNTCTAKVLIININTDQTTPTETFKLNEKKENFDEIEEDLNILFDGNHRKPWEILLERFFDILDWI